MKPMAAIVVGWILAFSIILPTPAQAYSAISVHEIEQEVAPKAVLEIQKDPTGGFNVHVVTTNFVWRPEMASMQHVPGEGHAHVYLDGRKIMRIYNEWFHLNTFQFATKNHFLFAHPSIFTLSTFAITWLHINRLRFIFIFRIQSKHYISIRE